MQVIDTFLPRAGRKHILLNIRMLLLHVSSGVTTYLLILLQGSIFGVGLAFAAQPKININGQKLNRELATKKPVNHSNAEIGPFLLRAAARRRRRLQTKSRLSYSRTRQLRTPVATAVL
jgi:hypothetical protein